MKLYKNSKSPNEMRHLDYMNYRFSREEYIAKVSKETKQFLELYDVSIHELMTDIEADVAKQFYVEEEDK
jgi:hypothetical protein|tara:strand:- start:1568 stop:1777 length:210 start_codon:yes stop_codon:yes gene_type:complete